MLDPVNAFKGRESVRVPVRAFKKTLAQLRGIESVLDPVSVFLRG